MDMEFERSIINRHLDNIQNENTKLQLEINILKHKLNLAYSEIDEYKAQAIWWAKQSDDYRHELHKVEAWCIATGRVI